MEPAKTFMCGNTNKNEIARIIVFAILSIIPSLLMLKGILRLIRGELITFAFAALFFIFPILIIISSFYIIRSNDLHIGIKIFICTIIYIILTIITFCIVIYGTFTHLDSYTDSSAIHKYDEDYFEETALPDSKDFGNYISFEYFKFESSCIIADSCAKTVICKYDNENYLKETSKLSDNYLIQSTPIGSAEPNVNINAYEFNMLSDEAYFDYFPKCVGFIGTNNKTNEIIYIYYYNVELDYINSTKDFILNYCGFKYIR